MKSTILLAFSFMGAFAAMGATVSVVSVSPVNNIGLMQTFTAVYSDAAGSSDLQAGYLDIGGEGAPHTCFVVWVRGQGLYLFDDTNSAILGPITPGSASTVSNSQCTLSGSGGTVTSAGNNVTVPFALTFSMGFGGPQLIGAFAQGGYLFSAGNSGWQSFGQWTPVALAPLSVLSVNPSNGSGLGPQTFNVVATDPLGAADILVVYFDVGAPGTQDNGCFVAFVPYSNTIYLFDDTFAGGVMGPINAGTTQTLSNSQCTVSGDAGTAELSGNILTVPINLTFNPAFSGSQTLFGIVENYAGALSPTPPTRGLTLGSWNP